MHSSSLPEGYRPPPSAAELPTEDGIPMEKNTHRQQMNLLIGSLAHLWAHRSDYFAGGNMFLYYSSLQAKQNDFRGPDFFVVLGTERRQRDAWILWEEGGKAPDVIIEITSPSTAEIDRGEKKRLYASVLRIPEYFIYDPDTGALEGYRLDPSGAQYERMQPDADGRLESRRLGLRLGVREGTYEGFSGPWLRWLTPEDKIVPTPEEDLAAYKARFGPLDGQG